jgi:RimJ/RimL family protein N-acetyltransferase
VHETTRLRFVPIRLDHIPLLVSLDSDPEVKRFIDGGKPTSRVDVERFVSSSLGHRWVAFSKASNEFLGWFGLVPSGAAERELGYRLRRDSWGAGLATEGAIAAVDFAFTVLMADRVWAQTMSVNRASCRVLEKTGLSYVRTFFEEWPEQIEGSDQGDVEYEIWREDP